MCTHRCHCTVPWGKNNEFRALSAYKHGLHERGRSSFDVTLSGPVINPEYSWLGPNLEGVVHDTGCTDPYELLEIKFPYNYHEALFLFSILEFFFFCRLEMDTPVLRELPL